MPPVALAKYATPEVMAHAQDIGRQRLEKALERARIQPFGDPGDENRQEIDDWSSVAESLVAQWLQAQWNDVIIDGPLPPVKEQDVGKRTEVKWTRHNPGHLILHDSDPPNRLAILVRKKLPYMEVVGWTMVRTTQLKKYQDNPKARNKEDYWFPANELLMCDLLYQIRHSV